MMLEQRKIVLPKPEVMPELVEELEDFQYSVTEGGTMKMGASGSRHDDCVIAYAIAFQMYLKMRASEGLVDWGIRTSGQRPKLEWKHLV